MTDERQQSGQQREGRDHHHTDGGRSTDGQAVDELHAHHVHAEQRDHHRDAGEENRSTRGVDGVDGCFFGTQVRPQTLAESRDDEECVVDTHADTDHGADLNHEFGHLHHVAEDGDDGDAGAETHEGGADGQTHRQHRTEGQHQDDDGGQQSDHFALGKFERDERVASVFDHQTRG